MGTALDSVSTGLGKRHCLAGLSLLYAVHALLFAPAGFLTTDEFLYTAVTERLTVAGTFFFDNGFPEFTSPTLRLLFLTPTPAGLASQYPAGYAFLAAPFYLLSGIRGLILLNTLAAVGLLWLTYRLAKLLFGDEDLALNAALILGLATFIADYAFAILPHAVAGLFMLAAATGAAESQRREDGALTPALVGGLMLGLGINIRVDVVMLAPLLAAWLITSASAPWGRVAALGLGMVPGLAVASLLNDLKFGTLNPIAYSGDWTNRTDNVVSLADYAFLLPLLTAGALAVVALSFRRVREWTLGWRGAAIAAGTLAVVIANPFTGPLVLRMLKGFYVLLIDLQAYDYIGRYSGQVTVLDGGWLLFAGNVKKALFENLPYGGFLALPLVGLFQRRWRAEYGLLFLLPAAWFGFFALNQWHGGQATNLRYFSPQLPFLAILAAAAWRRLGELGPPRPPLSPRQALIIIGLAAAGLLTVWIDVRPFALLALAGALKWLFYLGLAMAVAVLALPSVKRARPFARALFGLLLGAAFLAGPGHDVGVSHAKRSWYLENASDCRSIEEDALVIAHLPRLYYCHFMKPRSLTAVFRTDKRRFVDGRLIERALDQGRAVYVDEHVREAIADQPALGQRYRVAAEPIAGEGLYRLARAGDKHG